MQMVLELRNGEARSGSVKLEGYNIVVNANIQRIKYHRSRNDDIEVSTILSRSSRPQGDFHPSLPQSCVRWIMNILEIPNASFLEDCYSIAGRRADI